MSDQPHFRDKNEGLRAHRGRKASGAADVKYSVLVPQDLDKLVNQVSDLRSVKLSETVRWLLEEGAQRFIKQNATEGTAGSGVQSGEVCLDLSAEVVTALREVSKITCTPVQVIIQQLVVRSLPGLLQDARTQRSEIVKAIGELPKAKGKTPP